MQPIGHQRDADENQERQRQHFCRRMGFDEIRDGLGGNHHVTAVTMAAIMTGKNRVMPMAAIMESSENTRSSNHNPHDGRDHGFRCGHRVSLTTMFNLAMNVRRGLVEPRTRPPAIQMKSRHDSANAPMVAIGREKSGNPDQA